jgi:hypothetical protein
MRAASLLFTATLASAAVGPEHCAVVVNGDDWASLAVANAWLQARPVPPGNVVVLHGLPAGEVIPLDGFRRQILDAVEAALVQRGLAEQVQCLAYAPGIPTVVDFQGTMPKDRFTISTGSSASLTGMTVLAPLVAQGAPAFTTLRPHPGYDCQRRSNFRPVGGAKSGHPAA